MKKALFLLIFAVTVIAAAGCSYCAGGPDQTVKFIEVVTPYSAVKTGETVKLRFYSVTECGERREVAPDDIEYYLEDGDLETVTVEQNNLFTFDKPKKYELRFRLKNELSIKGKANITVYTDDRTLTTAGKKPDDIEGVKMNGKELTVTPPGAAQPLNALDAYDYLKANGGKELTAASALDCKKYYVRGDYESVLDLTYFLAVKIIKDGSPVTDDSGFKLYIYDDNEKKIADVFGNTAENKGFKGVEYAALVSKPEGEKFTDTVLTREIDSLYSSDPAHFIFPKDVRFIVFCEKAGRYEITIEAVLKDSYKKFLSKSYLLNIGNGNPEEPPAADNISSDDQTE